MTLQIFLTGLLLVSILTSLVTEAIKRILEEQKKQYYSNQENSIPSISHFLPAQLLNNNKNANSQQIK